MKTIRGLLVWGSNGEEDDIISVVREDTFHVEFFSKLFEDILGYGHKLVTVRYILSDKNIPIEDITTELAYYQATGRALAEYGMRYSELTGYLWTDNSAQVGGHNLIAELETNVGKYLHMEIIIHKGS